LPVNIKRKVQITSKLTFNCFGNKKHTELKLQQNNFIPNDGRQLAMDTCGYTDHVELPCASHAGEKEETHNQKKEHLV
jgi:hypothetical protein